MSNSNQSKISPRTQKCISQSRSYNPVARGLLAMIFCLMFAGGVFALPKIAQAAITYDTGTNKITVTGYTEAVPCNFNNLWTADKAGTLQLWTGTPTTNIALTTQIKPSDETGLKIDFILSGTDAGAGDTIDITGTDKDGNAQNETLTTEADGTYTTTKWFKTITDVDCNGFIAGTLTIQQGQWGVVWKTEENYFCEAHLRINTNSYFVDSDVSFQLGTNANKLNLTTGTGSYFELKSFSFTHYILTWPNWQDGEMVFEDGFLYFRSTGYIFKYKATLKNLYIDTISDITFYYTLTSGEIDNVIFDGYRLGLRADCIINKLTVKNSAQEGILVYYYPVHPIVRNAILTDNTIDIKMYQCGNPSGEPQITMLDSVFDKTKLLFACDNNFLLEKYSFDLKVIDKDGAVIVGATVTIKDQYNNFVSYVDSDANLAEVLDATETGIDVTDGTKFSVNDVILIDGEYMEVTNIAGNTLTVTRNYYGAPYYFAATHPNGKDIYIVQELTTNASGQIPTQASCYREFRGTSETETGYSPHTLKISHQDYPSREFEFTLDKKIDWTLALKDKPMSVGSIKVWGTEYADDEAGTIYAQVFYGDGSPCNNIDPTDITATVYNSNADVIFAAQMIYATSTNGIYKHDFTGGTFSAEGVYIIDVKVDSGPAPEPIITAYDSNEIHISQTANKVKSMVSDIWNTATSTMTTAGSIGKLLVDNIDAKISDVAGEVWGYSGRSLDTIANIVSGIWGESQAGYVVSGTFGYYLNSRISAIASDVWNYTSSIGADLIQNLGDVVWNSYSGVRKLTSRQIGGGGVYIPGVTESGTIAQVANEADQETVKYNVELVRKATFDFAGIVDSGSTITLVDSELDQPDDHWNNYELWMMSGTNIGLKRAICDFDFDEIAETGTITICGDALVQPIATNEQYVISHERKLVHAIWNWTDKQLTEVGNIATAVWGWTGGSRRLTSRYTDEASPVDLAQVADVSSLATLSELQKQWTVYLSDFGETTAEEAYRAKIWVLNYESVPTDPASVPAITIYDANRTEQVSDANMIKDSDGIYHYNYTVPADAVNGAWETVVSTEVEAGKTIQTNDYWEVEGSPAQVKINSISDNTVPSIAANITITNEGSKWYEYTYEYCVVSEENNACGGGDDVAYASDSKKLEADESWTTNLNLTVSDTGSYWFKVVVYWGTETSGASRTFTAEEEEPSIYCGDGICNGTETCSTCPSDCGVCGGGGGGGIIPPKPKEEVPKECWGADLNKDGKVNLIDFSILLYWWGEDTPAANPCVDINQDGKVNLIDFSIMMYYWTG